MTVTTIHARNLRTHMNKLRNIVFQLLGTALIAALTSSCSAEAKKARLMRRAEEFFKTSDYDKAKIEYTNVLRIDAKDPVPYEKIGVMWLEEGAPLRAGAFLMRAKELAPARAEYRTKLAELYIAVGGLAEARQEAAGDDGEGPADQEAAERQPARSRSLPSSTQSSQGSAQSRQYIEQQLRNQQLCAAAGCLSWREISTGRDTVPSLWMQIW